MPGHLGVFQVHWSPGVVCAHCAEAAVPKLDGKSADEEEEEHDQRPLTLSRLSVEALSHQGEVCVR